MFYVVTGGGSSGKSGHGELLLSQADAEEKFYIATMEVFGQEAAGRVERHRQMRAGKGFRTIEQPRGLEELWLGGEGRPAALVECMSNLAANELFGMAAEEETPAEEEGAAVDAPGAVHEDLESRAAAAFLRIQKGILHLRDQCSLLIVVTDEVFSDGICYEPDTETYIRLLGKLNAWMAEQADQVTEVVYGIPLRLR